MGRLAAVALASLVVALPAATAPLFDAVLAVVDARTVTASDIALARALHVLGFAPASSPIQAAEVQRFVDVLLILDEAARIGVTADGAAVDRALAAAVAGWGSEAEFERWLDAYALDRAWARRFVEDEVVRARFFEERFAAFVFPTEEQLDQALGPGEHDEATRRDVRARLVRESAMRAQAEWLDMARQRASIRVLVPAGTPVALPFPPRREAATPTRSP